MSAVICDTCEEPRCESCDDVTRCAAGGQHCGDCGTDCGPCRDESAQDNYYEQQADLRGGRY